MTAVAPAAPAPAVDAARRVGFSHLLMAEWTKIRSVRSTLWTLVIFVVVSLGLTGLLTWLTIRALNSGRAGRGSGADRRRPGQLHPRHRARAGPAGHLRARRARDHRRVQLGHDPGVAAGDAAALPHAHRQGAGLRRAGLRHRRGGGVRVVLHRRRHREQPLPGGAEPAGRDPGRDRLRALPHRARPVRAGDRLADPAHRRGRHHRHRPGPGDLQPHRAAAVQLGRAHPRLHADGRGPADHPGQGAGRAAALALAGVRRVLRLDGAAADATARAATCSSAATPEWPAREPQRGAAVASRRRRGRAAASGRRAGPARA